MITCASILDSETDSHLRQALLPQNPQRRLLNLARQLHHSLCAADENLGHLEEQLLRGGHEVFRQMLEKAAQQKADAAPPLCPQCQNKLSRVTGGHWTTIQTRFGPIRLQRARGYCQRCRKWRFPADVLLGLPEEGTRSPAVQEIAALTVSQMPAAQAEHLVERLAGIKISARWAARPDNKASERRKNASTSTSK